MHTLTEPNSQLTLTGDQRRETDITYVMKGSYAEKALETYHLILAPSFECNIGCKHCYLPNHDDLVIPKDRVLALIDEWSEISMADRGIFGGILHLKGGEPLVLPYFNDVLDRLEDIKTLRFMMTTNGIAGSREIVYRLGRLNQALDGNVQIIVSIDGSNDSVNALLRDSGNFERATALVRMLRDADITVYLNNVLHKGNLHDIDAYLNLAIDLDVQQINFLSFNPKGYGEKMATMVPDPDDLFKCLHALWMKSDQPTRRLLAGSLSDILHGESCGSCTSPECVGGYRGLLYIVPDGRAYSCPNLNCAGLEAGNINESSLRDIQEALLTGVYPQISTPQNSTSDKYTCKGISFTQRDTDSQFVVDTPNLQAFLGATQQESSSSYCFNRNW